MTHFFTLPSSGKQQMRSEPTEQLGRVGFSQRAEQLKAWGSAKRHFTSKAPERVFTWKTLFEDRAMPETTVQLAALFYGRAALRCLWPQGAEQAEQARRAHCKRMGTGTGAGGAR